MPSKAVQCSTVQSVQGSAAKQARRSCRRAVQLGAEAERSTTAEESPLNDDAQAGSTAGDMAMSRQGRPGKAVKGHRR